MNYFCNLFLFIAVLACIACNKQQSGSRDIQREEVELSASFEDETSTVKTHLEGLTPVWETNDSISVFGSSSSNDKFVAKTVSGSTAVFSGITDKTGPYVAVYPYNSDVTLAKGMAEVLVPSVQRLCSSKNIASEAMVSIASLESLSSALVFKNVTSLLKVEVEDEDITSLMFVSDGAFLSGRVSVSPSTAHVASVIEGSKTVTLLPEGETFEPGTYYFCILPCESEGITISATHSTDSRRGEKSTLKTFKAERNKILVMGKAMSSQLDWAYRIYNKEDLYAYAADQANWSIEEDINLCADIDMELTPWRTLDDRLSVNGTFEGNGHCIYNINIEGNDMPHVAFFGRYYKNVRNLTLGSSDGETYDGVSHVTNSCNVVSDAWTYTGGCIVWPAEKRTIENVKNFCAISTTAACTHKSRTAGVVVWIENEGVTVKDCENYGTITLASNSGTDKNINCAGVISGVNASNVTVDGCKNFGPVTGSHLYLKGIGGIIGLNYSAAADLVVKNCLNKGAVKIQTSGTQNAETSAGGIFGKAICKAGATPVKISNCINEGYVGTNANIYTTAGGIVGWAYGVAIDNCSNSGKIENTSVSKCYQAVGGIAGICDAGYGNSSIINCTNRGDVVYTGASHGYDKASSSGKVYGVDAGGITGLVCGNTDEISDNTNYGRVTGTNSYAGTSSYPKAYMFVGGIIGYDYGEIPTFGNNKNAESAVVTSNVTDATSKTKPYAVAGGIIGYQKNSTMISGVSTGTIKASMAASSGNLFAGTITGWNKAVITLGYYGGTVNGAEATTSNVVGYGNEALACAPASSSQTDNYDSSLDKVNTEEGIWD